MSPGNRATFLIMRNYIEKNIKQPAQDYVKETYDAASAAFDAETFIGNSVQGSINDRTHAKNCFIMGAVVLKGSAKMLECVVAKNAKVILEDGAIAYKCMFGGFYENKDVPVEIHIGKNSVVSESNIVMSLKLGDNSGIIISSIHSKQLGLYKEHAPVYTFGKQSLLANAMISLSKPCVEEQPARQAECTFGNRTVMVKNHMQMRDIVIKSGDDNTFGAYRTMLTACTQGIKDVIKPATVNPAHTNACDPLGGNLSSSRQSQMLSTNLTIGNRCYIASCLHFHAVANERQRASVTMDDEVICIFADRLTGDRYIGQYGPGISAMCANVSFAEGSTIVVKDCDNSDGVTYTSLTVGEGATVVWDNRRQDNHTALPTAIRISPYATARI